VSDSDLSEAFAEVRRLDRPVSRHSLPTEAEVAAVERILGRPLHEDFRRYLLEVSDVSCGTKEPVTIRVGGHTDLLNVVADARAYEVPDDLVPICEDNADFYCMTGLGEIVYWSHDGTTDERWPDLATWIREVWIAGG
jgi:hypothetical protein